MGAQRSQGAEVEGAHTVRPSGCRELNHDDRKELSWFSFDVVILAERRL